MRSWTTFMIFGAVLVAVMLFYFMSLYSTAHQPIVREAEQFLHAAAANDLKTLRTISDTNAVKPSGTGGTTDALNFDAAQPFEGAFSMQPAMVWSLAELGRMHVDTHVSPSFSADNTKATVKLQDGYLIYLHRVDSQWKVYYVTQLIEQRH